MVAVAWAGLQKAIPIIGRLLWDIGHLMLQAAGAWFVGVTTAARRMGEEAVTKAANKGVPSDYESVIYWSATVFAVGELLIGWIICSYVTVWLIGMIFHW